MDTCAKCGRNFDNESGQIGKWNSQLQEGYIKFDIFSPKKAFPEYNGMKLCTSCILEISNKGNKCQFCGERYLTIMHKCNALANPTSMKLSVEINNAILWQKDEKSAACAYCSEFIENRNSVFGADIGKHGFLVVTNQRVLFACSSGAFAKGYAITFAVNLENVASVSQGSFGRSEKIIILDQSNSRKDFLANAALIPTMNTAIIERKKQIQAEKQKENIQIILDFSSLKDVMAKGGIVMTTYKCPNCNGMVNIPETGKVLVCQYCGTPIKPVDIFEKIKELIK